MNTTMSNILAQVQFNSASISFDDSGLTGYLAVDQTVLESFIHNTLIGAKLQNEVKEVTAGIKDGLVSVSSSVVSQPGQGDWLRVELVSVAGEEEIEAGSLVLHLSLTKPAPGKVSLQVMPWSTNIEVDYLGKGHTFILHSAACWLVQDIAAHLYEDALICSDVETAVAYVVGGETEIDLANGLQATLNVTRQAYEGPAMLEKSTLEFLAEAA